MTFIYRIIGYLNDLSDFFYDLMLEVWDWPVFGVPVGLLFYEICLIFNSLAWRFSDFAEWLEWAQDEIEDILSWTNIKSLIRSWLDGIEDLIDWFSDWWDEVTDVIDDWWLASQVTVKAWISAATEGLEDLLEAWDNFWHNILPDLISFTWLETWWNSRLVDIQDLIDSTLKVWFPFYDDLVALWEEIKSFFASPLDWLWGKFTDWFLGKE